MYLLRMCMYSRMCIHIYLLLRYVPVGQLQTNLVNGLHSILSGIIVYGNLTILCHLKHTYCNKITGAVKRVPLQTLPYTRLRVLTP